MYIENSLLLWSTIFSQVEYQLVLHLICLIWDLWSLFCFFFPINGYWDPLKIHNFYFQKIKAPTNYWRTSLLLCLRFCAVVTLNQYKLTKPRWFVGPGSWALRYPERSVCSPLCQLPGPPSSEAAPHSASQLPSFAPPNWQIQMHIQGNKICQKDRKKMKLKVFFNVISTQS